jgi:hypothetical protein
MIIGKATSPQDNNNDPLSYERLNGEWLMWYETARRFEHKVPAQDRGDIRHNIILELAKARKRDNKPLPKPRAYRIASLTVALYWRKNSQKPNMLSLDTDIINTDGDTTELIDTVADDKAVDLEAWMDAKTWLMGCPIRLIQIANKRVKGINLTPQDSRYLYKFRKKEQKRLINGGDFTLN